MKSFLLTTILLTMVYCLWAQVNPQIKKQLAWPENNLQEGAPCHSVPTVTDIEGNTYNTVLIGNQCWLKENLKTSKYQDGTPIAYPGSSSTTWMNNTTGAYAWYNNDIEWKDKYGALYNWFAVKNTKGLCPAGWHIPDDTEWTQLINYVSGSSTAAAKPMKSCRQVNSPLGGSCSTTDQPRWNFFNEDIFGTNLTGFSALPGGYRGISGLFESIGIFGFFWSATEVNLSLNTSWNRQFANQSNDVGRHDSYRPNGHSVRCIKNNLAGDANCDGNVNVLDVIIMVNHIMVLNPTPFCFGNADVNASGGVDVLDIIGTINIIMQIGGK